MEDLPQNKMEKGSNAKIYIGWHSYDQNNLLNTADLVVLFYNSSVLSKGPWDIKSKSLCRYLKPSCQPIVQFRLVMHESPPTLHSSQGNCLIEVLPTHTAPWPADAITSAWDDCPQLVPCMGSYSSFDSQLQSLLFPSPALSTLYWPPWGQWSYALSLGACLLPKETVNSLREG